MTDQTPRPRRSRVAQTLSTILFIAAIAFAGAAIYLWYAEDDNPGPSPLPTAELGEAELANVLTVLQADEPDWTYGRTAASTDQLAPPGQPLTLGDVSLYVFIFSGESPESRISSREQAADSVDLDSMVISTRSGRLVSEGQPLHLAQASNVITILVGGDDELADQVEASLNNLP